MMKSKIAFILISQLALVVSGYRTGKVVADGWWKEHPQSVVLKVPAPEAPLVYSTQVLLAADKSCDLAGVCLLPDGHVAQSDSAHWTIKNILIDRSRHIIEGKVFCVN